LTREPITKERERERKKVKLLPFSEIPKFNETVLEVGSSEQGSPSRVGRVSRPQESEKNRQEIGETEKQRKTMIWKKTSFFIIKISLILSRIYSIGLLLV
jgi:hypothetical protein